MRVGFSSLSCRLVGVGIPEPGAGVGEGDPVADLEVPSAADDLDFFAAGVHGRQVQAVGVGMRVDAHDLADHYVVPVLAGAVDRTDLESRIGQALRCVVNGRLDSRQFAQPFEGNAHGSAQLPQEPQIVAVEGSDVGHAVLEHGDSLHAHAEGEALIPVRVVTDVG